MSNILANMVHDLKYYESHNLIEEYNKKLTEIIIYLKENF